MTLATSPAGAARRLAGPFLVLFACALGLFALVYRGTGDSWIELMARFPRVVAHIAGTVTELSDGAQPAVHPLSDLVDGHVLDSRPMRKAGMALLRSISLLASATLWILLLSLARSAILILGDSPGAVGAACRLVRAVDWPLEQLQRLPGIITYLLLRSALHLAGRPLPGGETIQVAILLSAVLAVSDGFVPDTSAVFTERFRDLSNRDYVKAGLVCGFSRLSMMRRELMMTLADLLSSRMLQIVGGAFVLELIFRYPGIGWLCVTSLFSAGSSGDMGGAGAVARSDVVYSALLLLLLLSTLVVLGRRVLQSLLDPRPRTTEAR